MPGLPPGIHGATLTDVDTDHNTVTVIVLWTDRPRPDCPRCGEHVGRTVESVPVNLNARAGPGGQVSAWSGQHHCGEWIGAWWSVVDPATQSLAVEARKAAAQLAERTARVRVEITARLVDDLCDVLLTPATSRDETGSETEPGVYYDWTADEGTWLAWAYDPADDGETITVTESDIPAGRL